MILKREDARCACGLTMRWTESAQSEQETESVDSLKT
jgi:hypothetical protein